MFWLIPIIFKAAAVYQGAKAAGTVIDYATTDQEAEGRELGATAAAKLYAPVLEDLEQQQKKIIDALDREHANVQTQINLLKEQRAYYKRKTADYKSKIETIRREDGDKPGVKAVFDALATSAAIGGSAIGTGAVLSGNFVRAFSSSIAGAGFSWLALPATVLTYILKSEMKEKRERFFKEEFEKKSREWLEKIESCKAKIVTAIKNLRAVKADGADKLNRLAKIVADAQNDYSEVMARYNILNSVVK